MAWLLANIWISISADVSGTEGGSRRSPREPGRLDFFAEPSDSVSVVEPSSMGATADSSAPSAPLGASLRRDPPAGGRRAVVLVAVNRAVVVGPDLAVAVVLGGDGEQAVLCADVPDALNHAGEVKHVALRQHKLRPHGADQRVLALDAHKVQPREAAQPGAGDSLPNRRRPRLQPRADDEIFRLAAAAAARRRRRPRRPRPSSYPREATPWTR